MDKDTLLWLLDSDPTLRWQVMRDLLGEPPAIYDAARARIPAEGWGADLLARQDPDGHWGGGIYSPKWISTTYTMLLLRQFGLSPGHAQARRACEHLVNGVYRDGGINFSPNAKRSETCITGMVLGLLGYFRHPDERIHRIPQHLLGEQMADGGWNCRSYQGTTHSSFHTTISVLEGLDEYKKVFPESTETLAPGIQKAHEFLLAHRLYKSHRTGEVADPAFTRMCFPPRWHYDFLRGLDYFQSVNAPRDERMADAIHLLLEKQTAGGRWKLNTPWAGKVFFNMEKVGTESRWNTLRAMRVLKWWNQI